MQGKRCYKIYNRVDIIPRRRKTVKREQGRNKQKINKGKEEGDKESKQKTKFTENVINYKITKKYQIVARKINGKKGEYTKWRTRKKERKKEGGERTGG